MKCAACGGDHPPGARFCTECGAALGRACPRCDHVNAPTARFCGECGAPLEAIAPPDPRFAAPRSYTPRELQEKILANRSTIEGQRKQVTVLSADIAGFTPLAERLDPEQTHEIATRCFDLLLAEVHRYEGHVAQFTGDGMLALFGAPIAHEDHAQRAVRAALGAQQALTGDRDELRAAGVDLRVRVGLNSGAVVVGAVGTDLNMTYTASGDSVNLAARVQSLAEPGTVTISHHTERLIRGYFVTRDLGERAVKGKSEPVRLFEVLLPSRSRSRVDIRAEHGLSPHVGRGRELELLLDRFAEARGGRGQVVFVQGEPGIGKSRLLFEAKRRLEVEDLAWVEGRCISYGYDISYYPVVDLLKDIFEVDEADDEGAILAKTERAVAALGEGLRPHLPYLKHLLAVDPGDPAVATMDPLLRKTRVFEALRALLVAAAALRPQVVVIEDLHWIDAISEQFLSYVADTVAQHPVLLVLTHRSGYEQRLGARPFVSRIELDRLSENESAVVAGGVLGAGSLPAELRELVYRKAEGNPLFVEEVVKSLLEVGAVRAAGDGYVLARPIEDVHVPDTVQDVIMARLDRLADEPRRAIQTAAVIGREFTVRLLERTSELGGRLEAHLKDLKAVELIFERSLFPELAYMFKHALTHDVAYGSLLSARRRSLHRLVGDAIEDLYRDRLAEHYEVLAYHYGRAEDWQKALGYGLEAARKAAARFAVRDAIGFYERALAASEHLEVPPSQLLALRRALPPLYFVLGDFPRSRAEAEKAVELARAIGDGAAEGAALFDAASAAQFAEDFPGALALAEQAAEVAQRTGAPTAWAGAEFISAYIRTITGELDQQIPRLERVIEISRAAGDVVRESLGLATLGGVRHWQGEPRRAAALTGEGLRIAREHNLVVPLTRNLWQHGMVLTAGGEYAEGLALLEEGLALVERIGDENNVPRYLNTIGWLCGECGDLDQALAKAEATIERARRRRHGIGVEQTAFSLVNMADAFMARGDLAAAGEALEETRRLADDPSHDWMKWRYKMHMLVSMGEHRLMRGEPDEADELAARSLDIAGHTTSRKYLVRGWRLQGEIAAARGRWPEAKDALGRALALARRIDNPPQLWKTLCALGQLHDALAERDAAAATFQDARRTVDEMHAGLTDERLRTSLAHAAESGILYRTAAPV